MKKIIVLLLCLAGALCAELIVPSGAVVGAKTTVVQPVAITKIEVAELRCILPTGTNTTESIFVVTMVLTDERGGTRRQVMRLTETEADVLMAGSEHNLSEIVASASAAIQQIVNQRFTYSP